MTRSFAFVLMAQALALQVLDGGPGDACPNPAAARYHHEPNHRPPTQPIIFIKTHKTASSTVAALLRTNGLLFWNMSVFAPRPGRGGHQWDFGDVPQRSLAQRFSASPVCGGHPYGVWASHALYHPFLHALTTAPPPPRPSAGLPPRPQPLLVTVVRHPVARVLSAWRYYTALGVLKRGLRLEDLLAGASGVAGGINVGGRDSDSGGGGNGLGIAHSEWHPNGMTVELAGIDVEEGPEGGAAAKPPDAAPVDPAASAGGETRALSATDPLARASAGVLRALARRRLAALVAERLDESLRALWWRQRWPHWDLATRRVVPRASSRRLRPTLASPCDEPLSNAEAVALAEASSLDGTLHAAALDLLEVDLGAMRLEALRLKKLRLASSLRPPARSCSNRKGKFNGDWEGDDDSGGGGGGDVGDWIGVWPAPMALCEGLNRENGDSTTRRDNGGDGNGGGGEEGEDGGDNEDGAVAAARKACGGLVPGLAALAAARKTSDAVKRNDDNDDDADGHGSRGRRLTACRCALLGLDDSAWSTFAHPTAAATAATTGAATGGATGAVTTAVQANAFSEKAGPVASTAALKAEAAEAAALAEAAEAALAPIAECRLRRAAVAVVVPCAVAAESLSESLSGNGAALYASTGLAATGTASSSSSSISSTAAVAVAALAGGASVTFDLVAAAPDASTDGDQPPLTRSGEAEGGVLAWEGLGTACARSPQHHHHHKEGYQHHQHHNDEKEEYRHRRRPAALLAARGGCSFAAKALVAQALGFAACVVVDPMPPAAAGAAGEMATGAAAMAMMASPPTPSLGPDSGVSVAVFMLPAAALDHAFGHAAGHASGASSGRNADDSGSEARAATFEVIGSLVKVSSIIKSCHTALPFLTVSSAPRGVCAPSYIANFLFLHLCCLWSSQARLRPPGKVRAGPGASSSGGLNGGVRFEFSAESAAAEPPARANVSASSVPAPGAQESRARVS